MTKKREFLKVKEAKPGMVELDKGFTCHVGGKAMLYKKGKSFFFYCDAGKHDLSGQLEKDHYIGVYPA